MNENIDFAIRFGWDISGFETKNAGAVKQHTLINGTILTKKMPEMCSGYTKGFIKA